MTTTPADGGPAFPVTPPLDRDASEWAAVISGGVSVRDYFAAKALPIVYDLYSRARCRDEDDVAAVNVSSDGGGPAPDATIIAEYAFSMADAMIAERARKDR